MKNEKTSLEKSHSKISNFILTIICLFAVIAVSLLWSGVALLAVFLNLGIILTSVGAFLTIIAIILLNKFTR